MSKNLKLTRNKAISEIRKPGPVFVFCNLTPDDNHVVQVVKESVINQIITSIGPEFEIEMRRDGTGLYLCW
jgi:hypothetical protein